MKKIIQAALISSLTITSQISQAANPEPTLYGTVTHENGQSVTGSIRWGDQESFLSDIFNGEKLSTTGIEHLSDDEKEALENHQPGPKAQIGGLAITFKSFFGKEIKLPKFNVHFGAIKKIEHSNGTFTVTLHDGSSFQTNDQHNDTSDEVFVLNTEGETTAYEIEDLSSIVFSAAPENAKTFNDGIYGTVNSELGTFYGRIMWDKDERTLSEKLDGNDESQEHDINFSAIKSIEKVNEGNAAKVELKDGNTLVLKGTNDVNNSNRGIWIDNPETGRVEIKWQQFTKLNIETVDVDWKSFNDYVAQAKKISGTITLKDKQQIKADALTFDLNQQSQAELFDADMNGSNRQVPFKLIKKITQKNKQAVELLMRNDQQMMAYGSRNVTQDNNGVLATINDKHQWYQWEEIESIEFD